MLDQSIICIGNVIPANIWAMMPSAVHLRILPMLQFRHTPLQIRLPRRTRSIFSTDIHVCDSNAKTINLSNDWSLLAKRAVKDQQA